MRTASPRANQVSSDTILQGHRCCNSGYCDRQKVFSTIYQNESWCSQNYLQH